MLSLPSWVEKGTGPPWLQWTVAIAGLLGSLFMLWAGTTLFNRLPDDQQLVALPGMTIAWGLAFMWGSLRMLPKREPADAA